MIISLEDNFCFMSHVKDRIFETFGPTEPTASEFFAMYSRFESALKGCGYCKDDTKPDWNRYYDACLKNLPDEKKKIDDAFNHLSKMKIQTHKWKDGKIEWRDAEFDKSATVFDLIKIVRNNLFHGGKYEFGQDGSYDRIRNEELVKACLKVLFICLDNENPVTEAFYSELGLGRYGNKSIPSRINK